jgi:hypothetical protein
MQRTKLLSFSTLTASLMLLVGCTTSSTSNMNVQADTNTAVTNTTVTANTNSDQGSEVDTSDWLTYTSEEYGFSFKYPKEWQISKDIFEEYKKSYDNPRYQINEKDRVFITSLTSNEVTAEINNYKSQTDEMGAGVIESIGKGKLISIAVSEKEVTDLISEEGFTFTIDDTMLLDQNIKATNVYLKKRWEGNADYHNIYIPLQSSELTNMGKTVKSVVFTIETNDGNYDRNALLNIAQTFQKNS